MNLDIKKFLRIQKEKSAEIRAAENAILEAQKELLEKSDEA